jgi:hypothetical protein
MFTFHPFDITCVDCPHFFPYYFFHLTVCGSCLSLIPITLHIVPFPLGTLSVKCLLSILIWYTPIYMHSAGAMCFVPTITSASPQVVIIPCLKCLSFFWCAFVATELEISASIIIVCFGGFSLLLIDGCVAFICFVRLMLG